MVIEIVISFAVMLGMAVILCVAAARGDIDGGELDDPVEEDEANNPSGADAPPPLAGEVIDKDNNVPRKYAYWVEEADLHYRWHCSNCGQQISGIASLSMKYCPECGARMEEHPWVASGCGQAFCPGKDE